MQLKCMITGCLFVLGCDAEAASDEAAIRSLEVMVEDLESKLQTLESTVAEQAATIASLEAQSVGPEGPVGADGAAHTDWASRFDRHDRPSRHEWRNGRRRPSRPAMRAGCCPNRSAGRRNSASALHGNHRGP
ncbi:MAG: hypothetical protein ACI9MR_002572 [Myxococcota bacterium]|jgi:hypothetical protein